MKCEDVQQLLADYWELPKHDLRRLHVDLHIRECRSCREEYELWKESSQWIKQTAPIEEPTFESNISNKVMERIYQTERWQVPVSERRIGLSGKQRLIFIGILSFLLALFVLSFIHLATSNDSLYPSPSQQWGGFVSVASSNEPLGTYNSNPIRMEGIVVASISDPYLLSMEGLEKRSNYYLVLSVFGIIMAVLTINWLTRMKQ